MSTMIESKKKKTSTLYLYTIKKNLSFFSYFWVMKKKDNLLKVFLLPYLCSHPNFCFKTERKKNEKKQQVKQHKTSTNCNQITGKKKNK